MTRSRRVAIFAPLIAATLALSGCATPAPPQPTQSPSDSTDAVSPAAVAEPPITLRLAVADSATDPSSAAVRDLVQQVATISGGRVTIVPTFSAGTNFEEGVVGLLQRGDADLALVASRAWDLNGERALEAFQAPFLIDNDALLDAVAASDIPARALAGMTTAVGLTMWPEDLRHFESFAACGADYTTASGPAGTNMWVTPSDVSYRLLEALGAKRWPREGGMKFDRNIDATACRLQGMEAGMLKIAVTPMDSRPILVSNVVPWPKLQVLAANKDAFKHLSDAQQAVLRQAADAVSENVRAHRRTDPDLAADWCAAGGEIVLAKPGTQDAYRTLAEPVYAALASNGATGELVKAIEDLKAATLASPPAQPCQGAALATPVPLDALDTAGYVGTMPPNGTYRRELVADDLIAAGLDPVLAKANEQVLTSVFEDGKTTFSWSSAKGGSASGSCVGTYESVGGTYVHAVLTGADANCGTGNWLWRQEQDGISFVYLDPSFLPSDHILLDNWVWTQIK